MGVPVPSLALCQSDVLFMSPLIGISMPCGWREYYPRKTLRTIMNGTCLAPTQGFLWTSRGQCRWAFQAAVVRALCSVETDGDGLGVDACEKLALQGHHCGVALLGPGGHNSSASAADPEERNAAWHKPPLHAAEQASFEAAPRTFDNLHCVGGAGTTFLSVEHIPVCF